jgi:hypothetical protein
MASNLDGRGWGWCRAYWVGVSIPSPVLQGKKNYTATNHGQVLPHTDMTGQVHTSTASGYLLYVCIYIDTTTCKATKKKKREKAGGCWVKTGDRLKSVGVADGLRKADRLLW